MIKEKNKTIFKEREEAFEKMFLELPQNIFLAKETVVLGVSEGGVYFSEKLSSKLNCRMSILLTEPIYSDINPDLVIAMVGETEEIVVHKALIDAFNISMDYIYEEADRKYQEDILNYKIKYRKGKPLDGLEDKYVILVDECVETGLTMMTAVKTVISLGAKNIFIAVPILDKVVYENLVPICDNIFCPYKIDDYVSIEYYYENVEPFDFEKIKPLLKKII
jgi:putative phosphoribosyl transferase